MKRFRMFHLALALVCIFGFYGVAFGGGGEGTACENPPDPTRGPFLYGTFTVAHDSSTCSIDYEDLCAHNNVHIVLRHKLNQVHLFSFPTPTGAPKSLCDYVASNPDPDNHGLKEIFASKPCGENFGEPFGFPPANYFPVIHEIFISKKDFCGSLDEMIFGLITIRLVPIK